MRQIQLFHYGLDGKIKDYELPNGRRFSIILRIGLPTFGDWHLDRHTQFQRFDQFQASNYVPKSLKVASGIGADLSLILDGDRANVAIALEEAHNYCIEQKIGSNVDYIKPVAEQIRSLDKGPIVINPSNAIDELILPLIGDNGKWLPINEVAKVIDRAVDVPRYIIGPNAQVEEYYYI